MRSDQRFALSSVLLLTDYRFIPKKTLRGSPDTFVAPTALLFGGDAPRSAAGSGAKCLSALFAIMVLSRAF